MVLRSGPELRSRVRSSTDAATWRSWTLIFNTLSSAFIPQSSRVRGTKCIRKTRTPQLRGQDNRQCPARTEGNNPRAPSPAQPRRPQIFEGLSVPTLGALEGGDTGRAAREVSPQRVTDPGTCFSTCYPVSALHWNTGVCCFANTQNHINAKLITKLLDSYRPFSPGMSGGL